MCALCFAALVMAGVLDDCHAVAHATGDTVWARVADAVGVDPESGWATATLLTAANKALDICPNQCIDGCTCARRPRCSPRF